LNFRKVTWRTPAAWAMAFLAEQGQGEGKWKGRLDQQAALSGAVGDRTRAAGQVPR
jgi:hypothetical protein